MQNIISNDDKINERKHDTPIITLTCQKKTGGFGFYPAVAQKFSCNISYTLDKDSEGKTKMIVIVLLQRKDNDKVGFSFADVPSVVTEKLRDLKKLDDVQAKNLGTTGIGEKYNFNFPEMNKTMFDGIADVIDSFKEDAAIQLNLEQSSPPPPPPQQQQPPSPNPEQPGSINANVYSDVDDAAAQGSGGE